LGLDKVKDFNQDLSLRIYSKYMQINLAYDNGYLHKHVKFVSL